MQQRRTVLAFLALVTALGSLLAPPVAAQSEAPPATVATADERPTDPGSYVSTRWRAGGFPLAVGGRVPPVVVSESDYAGVRRVARDLARDVRRVTGVQPAVTVTDDPAVADRVVIVGTLGQSPLVDDLAERGLLETELIEGRWETSLQQVVEDPLPGVEQALVIAGSDQRGTIYAAYDVSRGIGVSPWYWWDDVRPARQDRLYVAAGAHTQGTPDVRYRGFFINDENPALGRWAPGMFGEGMAPGHPGGFNHKFYARVFEVLLRLRANYLWPAVWGRAFAEDDPRNHATATRYGVVMGTSHEAPMLRGIEEWNRHATEGSDPYGGTGEWSFVRNRDAVTEYFRDGVRRMEEQDIEGVVTLGMRGPGDVGLPDGDAMPLMEDIIATQRQILEEESDTPVTEIPQVWTLYKEVQRYWDRGLRVPDDVTVVFTDDNWGNLRKLPEPGAADRSGGYGLYYHFDYVGGGRNYKWVDTINTANTWEQLHLAREHGVDRLWMVNVGDLKNQELPLQFFLDYAWDAERWPLEALPEWHRRYAAENFGRTLAGPIADVLTTYGQLQARRKPELLNRRITLDEDLPPTDAARVVYDDQMTPYSLENYREIERVTDEWQRLAKRAQSLARRVPVRLHDAFFELVGYQVEATANLYALREAEFTNLLYAEQGRAATNPLANRTRALFSVDQAMSEYYNEVLADGKWEGFQTQPKIGYGDVERYGPNAPWQQPERDNEALPDQVFPAVRRIHLSARAEMGVGLDGSTEWWPHASTEWWPHASTEPVLPAFSRYQTAPRQYVEVFNRGAAPFTYRVRTGQPWLRVDDPTGTVDLQRRLEVRVDWKRAPAGVTEAPIIVRGSDGTRVKVTAVVDNRRPPGGAHGFVEAGGYVAMDAAHATRVVPGNGLDWLRIPGLGRSQDAVAVVPGLAPAQEPGGDGARLEFDFTSVSAGPVDVTAYLSPRNSVREHGLHRYAVSLDGGPPQIVDVVAATGADHTGMNKQWERNTSDNVNRTSTTHDLVAPGPHALTFWAVDPTVILQRLVIDTGGLRPSYLGPPESLRLR